MSGFELMWRGKSIQDHMDMQTAMCAIVDTEEVQEFMTTLNLLTDFPGMHILSAVLAGDNIAEAEETLTRFSGRECHGEFFIVETPMDEFGNTGLPESVLRVRFEKDSVGLFLTILGPEEISGKWNRFRPGIRRCMVTDGPERMLNWEEWKKLVGFERKCS